MGNTENPERQFHTILTAPSENTVEPLRTYSMVHSPSWEANWFAASQEIPRISRNPNVHYRTQKRSPLFLS